MASSNKSHKKSPKQRQSQSELEKRAAAKIRAVLNAGRKKSVHISLFTTTHTALRKNLLERELSIQEVFEHFASLVNDGHPNLVKILDDYVDLKREKLITRLEEKYTENLYRLINDENPFEEGDQS